jgi:Amt family ammonium transporter
MAPSSLLSSCGAGVAFFCFGFAFAYGGTNSNNLKEEIGIEHSNTFIGNEHFFLLDYDGYAFWFYQFVFAATCTTIVAGALAERSQMVAYFFYSVVLSGFVFPVVAHAVWSIDGFLNAFKGNRLFDSGMIDIAGSGVVHITGGLAALIASVILGPRRGRFHDENGNPLGKPERVQGYSVSLQVLGTFLLWFGWYGFNVGSVHFISTSEYARVASLAVVTTTLGAAGGTITSLAASAFWAQKKTGEIQFDVGCALNGCLSGLVGITAGTTVIEPWAALVIGSVSGILYLLGSGMLIRLRVDDAVDAIPVHLVNGIWGVIAVGLFASPERLEHVLQRSDHVGWFYSWGMGSSDARLLAANAVGILFIVGFVILIMLPFFVALQYFGWLRADPLEEIIGLDFRFNGEVDHDRHQRQTLHHGITSGDALHRSAMNNTWKKQTRYDGVMPEVEEEDQSTKAAVTVTTIDS